MFLNETMHPEALGLFDAMLVAERNYDNGEDSSFYGPLVMWWKAGSHSDLFVADLYARMEEGLSGWRGMNQGQRISKLSRMLHETSRVVLH